MSPDLVCLVLVSSDLVSSDLVSSDLMDPSPATSQEPETPPHAD